MVVKSVNIITLDRWSRINLKLYSFIIENWVNSRASHYKISHTENVTTSAQHQFPLNFNPTAPKSSAEAQGVRSPVIVRDLAILCNLELATSIGNILKITTIFWFNKTEMYPYVIPAHIS